MKTKIMIELDEEMLEQVRKLTEINSVDYELIGNWIEPENLAYAVRDAMIEYDKMKEKYEEYVSKTEHPEDWED